MARIWFSGPRMGPIRPGISFGLGPRPKQPRQRETAPASGQCVYVIEGSHGAIKIGISSDPEKRRATLQTGAPHHLFLAFAIYAGDAAFDVEQEAHAILDAHRMPGEWFAVSKELAIATVYGAAARLGVSLGDEPRQEVAPPREINVTLWLIVFLFAAGIFMHAAGLSSFPAPSRDYKWTPSTR